MYIVVEWILETIVNRSAIQFFKNLNITFLTLISFHILVTDNLRVSCITFNGAANYRQSYLKRSGSASQESPTKLAFLTHLACCFLLYVNFEILFKNSSSITQLTISQYLSNGFNRTIDHNRDLVSGNTYNRYSFKVDIPRLHPIVFDSQPFLHPKLLTKNRVYLQSKAASQRGILIHLDLHFSNYDKIFNVLTEFSKIPR